MRVNNFSLFVHPSTEKDSGHAVIEHGSHYSIKIGSHLGRRSDVEINVDGKLVTTLRLEPYETVTLEGPPDDPQRGKFTAYARDSDEGQAVGGGLSANDRGLIECTFRPELRRPAVVREARSLGGDYGGIRDQSCGFSEEACVTGLSGRTDQRFRLVQPLEYDAVATVTISIRLVATRGPRVLKDVREPKVTRNPVPAPVE